MSKLLFFDIDGTLCMPGEAPTERTISAIRRARAQGNRCFLSTGRNITSIPQPVGEIGFDGYITNAGATAQVGEELLLSVPIAPELLEYTMEQFQKNRACCVLQTNRGNYCDYSQIDRVWERRPPEIDAYVEFTNRLLDVRELSRRLPDEAVYKICFYTPDEAGYHRLRRSLSPYYSFTMFDNLFDSITLISGEVNQLCVDKGRALNAFCAHFGMDPADCVAFGDSTNDLEMIRGAGIGVAMANAQPEVKQYADLIAPPCQQDGVAQVLEQMGLA